MNNDKMHVVLILKDGVYFIESCKKGDVLMIRGTTAQFQFELPYPKEELLWATIKFWQPNNPNDLLPIIKRLKDCTTSGDPKILCVSLTTEETCRFVDKYKAKMQLRAQHVNGTVFGNKQKLVTVYPMPDDIIEEEATMPGANEDGWIILDGETVTTDGETRALNGDGVAT